VIFSVLGAVEFDVPNLCVLNGVFLWAEGGCKSYAR